MKAVLFIKYQWKGQSGMSWYNSYSIIHIDTDKIYEEEIKRHCGKVDCPFEIKEIQLITTYKK